MIADLALDALNYVGIVAFAVSGALKAGEKGMDVYEKALEIVERDREMGSIVLER